MPVKQGDLSLLQHPAAQELLRSKIPARLAYVWMDGTPRVVPIWFHWNGSELVMGTPPKAPKLKALAKNPKVSVTIDEDAFPHKVLMIRGTAKLNNRRRNRTGIRGSSRALFRARIGTGVGDANGTDGLVDGAGVGHAPWVGLLDFQTRFPSALPL